VLTQHLQGPLKKTKKQKKTLYSLKTKQNKIVIQIKEFKNETVAKANL
jgi:hypothetical protein